MADSRERKIFEESLRKARDPLPGAVKNVSTLCTNYIFIYGYVKEHWDQLNAEWERVYTGSPYEVQMKNLKENLERGLNCREKYFRGDDFFTQVTSLFEDTPDQVTMNYMATVLLGRTNTASGFDVINEAIRIDAVRLKSEVNFPDFNSQVGRLKPFSHMNHAIEQTLLGRVRLEI